MGIFTPPKAHLDPELFDEKEQLLPKVREYLLHRTYTIIPENEVEHVFILGSSIGHTWSSDSDIDLNVVLAEGSREVEYWHPIVKKTNGYIMPSSRHPINLFVQNYHESDWSEVDFEVYDLTNNEWVKPPIDPSLLPNVMKDNPIEMILAKHKLAEIKDISRELVRAYTKWRISDYQTEYYSEVAMYLKQLARIFTELDQDRKLYYQYGWGVPRYSPANIIFKFIDKANYLHILEEIKQRVLPELEGTVDAII